MFDLDRENQVYSYSYALINICLIIAVAEIIYSLNVLILMNNTSNYSIYVVL